MVYGTAVAAALVACAAVGAPSQRQIDQLGRECEKQREAALAPIRAERIQDCKEQGLRTPDHCERYYQTYGNVGRGGGVGAGRGGMFFDLPVCQDWIRARETGTASRSRTPS